MAKGLELQLQHQSFQWIFRIDFLYDFLVWYPCSEGTLRVFSNTTVQKHQFFSGQLSRGESSHVHTRLLEKSHLRLDGQLWQSNLLLFNILCRFVIAFHLRSKRLLISWLQSPSALILQPPQIKSLTVTIVSPSICHEVMGPDVIILAFWKLRVFCYFFPQILFKIFN